jgi:DNA repair exonuclease SbcCD ATPase subunit
MIRRLELPDFGKFRKAELVFGPFTVITGPNEAGKTTVFDALFDTLCAGSRHEGRPLWKNLAGRYTALRQAGIVWEEGASPLAFGDNEFIEIFSIRGGELGVHHPENKGDSAWALAAENALLNSGLNPAQLAAELTDKAESVRKGYVQANIRRLRESIKNGEQAVTALKAEHDAIIAGAAEAARLEAEKAQRTAELAALNAEVKVLAEQIEKLTAAGRRTVVLAGLKALRELKEAREAAAAMAAFAVNEIPSFRALKETQLDAEKAAAAAEAAHAEKQASLAAAVTALEQLGEREAVLRGQSGCAEGLAPRVAEYASEPERVVTGVNTKMRYGIWAGGAALAALVGFSGGSVVSYIAAAAIAGAAAWAGIKLSITETLAGHTPEEVTAFLTSLADEWAAVSVDAFQTSDLEAARAQLAKAQADHQAVLEAYEAKTAEIGELETAVIVAGQTAGERKAAAEAAEATGRTWFKAHGAQNEDDYQAKVGEYKKLAERAGDLEQRVLALAGGSGCGTEEDFKDKLFAENGDLERRGIEPFPGAEAELAKLRREAAALAEKTHEAETALNAVTSALGTSRAVSEARLGGLPARINQAETELDAEKAELAGLELQARAYTMAAGAFARLAETSAMAFETLGKEVTETLRAVLPEVYAEFKVFDAAGAAVTDAGGIKRAVKNLSSGMRDLFMLAARLTIARRARLTPEGLAPGLLVLDEPFYTLDKERERAALKLLGNFHKTTGWQVIILTKDAALTCIAKAEGIPVTDVALA